MRQTLNRHQSSSLSSSEVEVSMEQDTRRENGSDSNGMASREVRIEDSLGPEKNGGNDSPGL